MVDASTLAVLSWLKLYCGHTGQAQTRRFVTVGGTAGEKPSTGPRFIMVSKKPPIGPIIVASTCWNEAGTGDIKL